MPARSCSSISGRGGSISNSSSIGSISDCSIAIGGSSSSRKSSSNGRRADSQSSKKFRHQGQSPVAAIVQNPPVFCDTWPSVNTVLEGYKADVLEGLRHAEFGTSYRATTAVLPHVVAHSHVHRHDTGCWGNEGIGVLACPVATGFDCRTAVHEATAAGAAASATDGKQGMLALQTKQLYQINKFYNEKVAARRSELSATVREVVAVVQSVLKEVETHEPRFVSSLRENDRGRYEGLIVNSPTEFEVLLLLNQMSVFNFVDDGAVPGCAVLRLSDGRKRSMSLWVEFITASGYLSARKIRSRFQTLVAQSIDKCHFRDVVRMVADTSDVKLRIRERYVVQITPAFKCTGTALWPPSASGHWPPPSTVQAQHGWPSPALATEIKAEGYHLLSKDSAYMKDKQNSSEGDSWVMSFTDAEDRLLRGHGRRKVLSVLRCLRERHLCSASGAVAAASAMPLPQSGQSPCVVQDAHIRTLLLYECEKHPRDGDWSELALGDRVQAVLLQLVSCLQNRRCPHYFLASVDLFKGASASAMDGAAKAVWHILREMLTNSRCLDNL